MPRQARAKHPQQAGPYLLRPKPPMAQVQYMPGHIANMPGHLRFDSWSSTRSNRSSGPSSATYNPRHHGPLPPMDLIPPLSATSTTHTITPSQSGPWSAEEDKILLHARSRSIGWEKVHQEYFPTKTPNACRKRYERLMQKRKANDWDDQRLEALALAYRDHREQMWRILGDRLGERWEHVEKAVSRSSFEVTEHADSTSKVHGQRYQDSQQPCCESYSSSTSCSSSNCERKSCWYCPYECSSSH